MVDYRRFLDRREMRVLAHLGGDVVHAGDRALRLAAPVAPGWWRFALEGRRATAEERVEPEDPVLRVLPDVNGHMAAGWLVHGAARAEVLNLGPEEDLPLGTPVRARRWYSDDVVYERTDLEEGIEDEVRRQFEERQPIGALRGVPATLRAAFALAVVRAVSADLAPLEVRAALGTIADEGWPAAEREHLRVVREREAERRRVAAARIVTRPEVTRAPLPDVEFDDRARLVLAASGATLRSTRRLAGGLRAVTWTFEGQRLRAVVHEQSLQVMDAGICLSGHDREVTLDSLPSVVREAVDTGRLVITSREW